MRSRHRSPRAQSGRTAPRRQPVRRVPPALEWAEDAAGRCARLTAIGGKSMLVENHTGLLSFSDELVRLDTCEGALCVRGDGLTLEDARPGALIVRGNIRHVELPCQGGDAPDEG